jgi:hypothetical protein
VNGLPRSFGLSVDGSLGLGDLHAGRFASFVHSRVTFSGPMLNTMLAGFENLRTGLAKLFGILGCALFSASYGLVGIFDGARGAGAAVREGAAKRPLDQKLVCQDQRNEEQNRRHGSEQKCPDLLKDCVHAVYSVFDQAARYVSRFGVEQQHFFVSGLSA